MSRAGNGDANHIEAGSRYSPRQVFVRGLSADAKETATIFTTKDARDAAARQRDPIGNVPVAINTDDRILLECADPDTFFAIEADSIGLANVGEATAKCERAVRADLEVR